MEFQNGQVGILQRTKLERHFHDRADPYIVVRAHIAAPYVQVMHFGIVEIRPLALIEDQCAVFDIADWIKGLHGRKMRCLEARPLRLRPTWAQRQTAYCAMPLPKTSFPF